MMRIDELAQRAGVPTRTIRYYTQQGLLTSPSLRGRVGYYDEQHLERLRLIKELKEKRYLPLSVIRSVVRHYEAGTDLDTMLVPLDMVFAPRWDASDRREFTRDELALEAGVDVSVVDAAEEMGFLFPTRQKLYTQDDLHMLEVADEWLKLGLPKSLGRLYRNSLEKISRMQVRAFDDCVVAPVTQEELPPDVTRDKLMDGYKDMSRVFNQLVGMLHHKLLQKAVERYAAR